MDAEVDVGRQDPFRATKIWNALVKHVRSEVEPKRRRYKFQYFDDCFRGCDIVRVLQSYVEGSPQLFKDVSRNQLKSFCQVLQERKVIEPVTIGSAVKEDIFHDGSKLYRFVIERNDMQSSRNSCERMKRRKSFDRALRPILVGNAYKAPIETRKRTTRRRSADELFRGMPELESRLPLKRRRRSLDVELSIRKSRTLSQPCVTASHILKATYQKVSLSNLLRLIDASFLDDILAGLPSMQEYHAGFNLVLTDHDREAFDKELLSVKNERPTGSNIKTSVRTEMCKVARACFSVQRKFPLPHSEAFGVPNLANFTASEILNILTDYFLSLEDSLIPSNMISLVDEVMKLFNIHKLSGRTDQTVRALQLLLLLIPLNNRKHLQQLLCFVELAKNVGHITVRNGCGTRFIVRKFVSIILPREVVDKENALELVSFMIEEQKEIFVVPSDIKEEATRQYSYLLTGNSCPPLTSVACCQISLEEYSYQKQHITQECLNSLMNFVIENVNLSLKEKEVKVSLFQRHHPEVFLLQFPDGKF